MTTQQATKYELLFSDLRMGHPDLGWMPRKSSCCADDEDLAYQRFLRAQGVEARVHDGYAFVTKSS
jgi:hypothetical protein